MLVNAAKKRPGRSDMMNMFVVQDRNPGFSPRIKTSRSGNKSSTRLRDPHDPSRGDGFCGTKIPALEAGDA
jgi:hypothetical protein